MANAQTLEALKLANSVKAKRRVIRKEINQGKRTAASVILDPPDQCGKMTLGDVLDAQDRWGAHRVAHFCHDVFISSNRELRKLTARQRKLIAGKLG